MNDYAHLLALKLRSEELKRRHNLRLLLEGSRPERDRLPSDADVCSGRRSARLPALRRFLPGQGA